MKTSLSLFSCAASLALCGALSAQTTVTTTTNDADAAAAQPPVQASAAGSITPATTQPTTLYQPGPSDAQVGPYYQGRAVTVESIGEREARFNAMSNGSTIVTTTTDVASNSAAQSGIRTAFAVMRTSSSPSQILNAGQIASSFEQAPFESRLGYAVYGERIQAANSSISVLANRNTQFGGDSQGRLQQAMIDLNTRRAQLDSSLNAAENATPTDWDQARVNLARDYRSYSDAMARVQSIASH